MISNLKIQLWLKELALFGATQLLGIIVAQRYLFELANSPLSTPAVSFRLTPLDIIVSALLLGFFIWAVIKRTRMTQIVFKLFFFIVIIGGTQVIFSAFFSPILSLILTILLVVLMIVVRSVMLQNVAVMLAIAGIGLVIGLSITPLVAVWALLILSFYDIFAVYVSKHMVKMAEGMVASRAIFGFIIPMEFSGFREKIERVKPGDHFMILGSGDIVLPLVLSIAALKISLAHALVVTLFSLGGLFVTHLLFVTQKQRRPMAALPPIAMMSIVGYLVSVAIF
ncbi:MAG: presenilin family intramembrane aspartyl protease [bacterium]|nr:presenilin family intramembrane aspartyl protease [bacterium]